jgi:hypothetical protein
MTPINWRRITQICIGVVVVFLASYDIFVYVHTGNVQTTISRVTLAWSREWPIVPFAVGVVCGHLFWPQRPWLDKSSKS